MILQSTDELEDRIGNKYSLVIVAAKRARQLKEGHPALAQDASPNPLSIALREIDEEKVTSIAPPEEELAPAPRDVISSLIAGVDFDMDEEDLDGSDAVDDLAALLVGTDDEDEEDADAEPDADAETDDLLTPATDDDSSDDDEEEAEADTDDEADEDA